MSAIGKAEKFIALCKENGWTGDFDFDHDIDWAKISAKRGGERLIIEWCNNQLSGPPTYILSGVPSNLHCASVARRTIAGKPDLEALHKRARRAQNKAPVQPASQNTSDIPAELHVPFDIWEDPDKVILKACRSATLVWRNRITGLPEMEFVPFKVPDGRGGVRVFNWDLTNVYFIRDGKTGPYLSFMNVEGIFRAVALEALMGVV